MLLNYIKISVRNFRKQRLFSALNIFGLAIGMAAVWLMVLYVADELSYDRFHAKADRIFRVVQSAKWDTGEMNIALTSAPFAAALQNDYPEIEKTVRVSMEGGGVVRVGEKKVKANDIAFTDATIFDVFSYPFLYGDPKTALSQPEKIVLTKTLAENLFGDASKAIGQTVFFSNNYPNTVTGVIEDVPSNSHFTFSALRSLSPNYTAGWQQSELYTYILLKNSTDYTKLESKLGGFFPKYLKKEMGDLQYKMDLQPITSIHLHSNLDFEIGPNGKISTIYVFSAIALLILVIACINYVNLYTARSMKRIREVGVRKAIGSERFQLIAQFFIESFLMTFIAGMVAFLLVVMLLPFFNQLAEKSLTIDHNNVLVTTIAALSFIILVGTLSGLYPAILFSGFRPITALKGQFGSQSGGNYMRKSLVVFQFMATVVMIACSAIVYKQMRFVNTKDLGFNKSQVLTFHVDKDEVRSQVGSIKERLTQSPLIESASSASNPIGSNNIGNGGMIIETETGQMPATTQNVQKFSVDNDFIKTMEIKLLAGRDFNAESEADLKNAVIVNESLVKKQGWKNPVSKRIRYFIDNKGTTQEAQVVGVVKDFHIYSLQHKIEPLVLQLPAPADRDNMYVRIQAGKTQEALAYLSNAYKSFDPEATLDFHFLDETFAQQYRSEQKQGDIMMTFAILAVIIACLGLFGLAAFAAESRTKEIGVRKVLGASVQSVVFLLSKDFIKLVIIAIIIGTPIAIYAMTKWLQNFEYRENLSWWVFALSGLIAMVIAVATVSLQALKSALMDPVKSLRTE
ncbi:ABC transporter permease [Dyadobacter arcticus]|uniref:ABC transport system permease protein n=1 Tax=Dyadobacter arcticus TaxID=1078754 RepID=A0ABX0UKE1_9BACT|nr:ABC transporter permease [Dyadobacter arcticus]NIJ51875.1 putative ABC transport system permease protein [Dyadobacter arcticus]